MKPTFLAISIGNTRTQFAAFDDGEIAKRHVIENWAIESAKSILGEGFLASRDGGGIVLMASVQSKVAEEIESLVQAVTGVRPVRVERDVAIPIGRQLDPESIVGEDRLLNAAAAYELLKQACIIVDAGTAITVDFVDGAGTFHGGAIAPGVQMMLDALASGTSQLPEVDFKPPAEAIGHSTIEAMRTAAFHGSRGIVRELVEKFAEQAGSYPMVIATGGDAQTLFADYDLIDRIVEDLTLRGLAATIDAHLRAEK